MLNFLIGSCLSLLASGQAFDTDSVSLLALKKLDVTTCPAICRNGNSCRIGNDYKALYPKMGQAVCYHGCSRYGWCGATAAHYSGGTDCCGCAPSGTDFHADKSYKGSNSCPSPAPPAPPTQTQPGSSKNTCPAICRNGNSCRIGNNYKALYPKMGQAVCYHGCSVHGWCGATAAHYSGGTDCCGCAPSGTDFHADASYKGSNSCASAIPAGKNANKEKANKRAENVNKNGHAENKNKNGHDEKKRKNDQNEVNAKNGREEAHKKGARARKKAEKANKKATALEKAQNIRDREENANKAAHARKKAENAAKKVNRIAKRERAAERRAAAFTVKQAEIKNKKGHEERKNKNDRIEFQRKAARDRKKR